MLEKLGTAEFKTISRPRYSTIDGVRKLLEGVEFPIIAEIGVGATTKGLVEVMNGRGKLHIFDFQHKVDELFSDLAKLEFSNIIAHGNSPKYWDSYHWSLMKLWQSVQQPIFDYVYLDGAHALLHDTVAFFLADKLLKEGGTMELDDYNCAYSSSKSMSHIREKYMTKEQEESKQIKMAVDTFINGNRRYKPISENRVYQKLANA